LVETLTKYFANLGNLARTARALNVHNNTLVKRIERIGEILGPNWQEPETALRLQLAVHHLNELINGRGGLTSEAQ
jgi:DNA-binding PucR family transcriptional regulator